jgi:hypothetical protein
MEHLNDKIQEENEQLEERVEEKPKKRQFLEDANANGLLGWVEKILCLINNYGFKKILQAIILIGTCAIFFVVFDAIREENLVRQILIQGDSDHTTASQVRKEVDPKITKTLTRMLYSMDADRVSVLEMHNGKENPTSLPFLYCDMTYEETRDDITYVSEEYEDLNMSKFQFPSFLYKNKIFYGHIDEIIEIDKKLGLRLEMNDVKYIGMVLIRTSTDIGFITISWMEKPNMSKDAIIADLTYYVQEIGTYLDYGQYKKINR